MASKKILLLIDSDRNAFPLIRFLATNAKLFSWKIKLGTMFDPTVKERIKTETFATTLEFIDFKKKQDCEQAIRKSDLVIAMVHDTLLLDIADSCITHRKTLISPARLNRQMALKKPLAKENNVLILMDCGFAPGLDHIIAKKAIDNIHSKGGKVLSFKTYSGSFLAESREPNPWQFGLTEPSGDLLAWGKHNNRHLLNGRMQHIPCHRLFERGTSITVRQQDNMMTIPEGDSLYYRKIYDLIDAHTVIKGKLIRRGFDRTWNVLVKTGLTDSSLKVDFIGEASFYNLLDSLLPPPSHSETIEERLQHYAGADREDIDKLKWLGLFDNRPWGDFTRQTSPAQWLQHLLEEKFSMRPGDRDTVVMQHQLGYEFRDERYELTATLVLEGEGEKDSALARVVGLTCGAAAKSVLLGSVSTKGLQIPIVREIYDPILNELEDQGIAFQVEEKKSQAVDIKAV